MATTVPGIEYRLLGPLEVLADGRPVSVGGRRRRLLLTLLLLHANRAVSQERLIDDLWGEWPPATAVNALQVHVSHLRQVLASHGGQVIVRRGSGYLLSLARDQLDLHRFEDEWLEGRRCLKAGQADSARALLVGALALWRGEPLAEFATERFADADVHRLAEMRLAALGDKIDAELALGMHYEAVGELDALVRRHPLQERPLAQLMLALYRCGRQADALAVCRAARQHMLAEFGLSLGPGVQRLERAILQQDAALDPLAGEPSVMEQHSVLLGAQTSAGMKALVALCAPMAAIGSRRELILAQVVARGPAGDAAASVSSASEHLARELDRLRRARVAARAAAFTSEAVAADLVRLADEQSGTLMILDATDALSVGGMIAEPHAGVLASAPCDVGLVIPGPGRPRARSPVLVPFGGGHHDWSALEVGCWMAQSVSAPLRLVGALDGAGKQGDASRGLAAASLVVQRAYGIVPEPALIPADSNALVSATADARVLVMGLSERWQREGVGPVRAAVAARAVCPVVFVRRGLRPGGLAPVDTMTRFTWSLGEAADVG